MPEEMVTYLTSSLGLTPDDVYMIDGPLNVSNLMSLHLLDRPELKDKPFQPVVPRILKGQTSIFEVINRKDILLHHPFTSYTTLTDFINAAANDPNVLAIKMCLYRTGQNSPIPPALIAACEQGKQAHHSGQRKARFDEEDNRMVAAPGAGGIDVAMVCWGQDAWQTDAGRAPGR